MGTEQHKFGKKPKQLSKWQRAWNSWSETLPEELQQVLTSKAGTQECSQIPFKLPYLQYDNFLVINQAAFRREMLAIVVGDTRFTPALKGLWKALSHEIGIRHIGVNAPIPLLSSRDNFTGDVQKEEQSSAIITVDNGDNILRSPVGFQPIFGDFGPLGKGLECLHFPIEDSDSHFWARATQFGVTQTWCPLFTMFSNGNIKEKERILELQPCDVPTTAVDLYAGIGYFSFFYRRRSASLVLGWEINRWSIEGFRRGAKANGWGNELKIVEQKEAFTNHDRCMDNFGDFKADIEMTTRTQGLVLFAESNVHAYDRIKDIRHNVPPIRHVNCGYLPTSKPSWEAAVQIIDPKLGGWIRAHENVSIIDIESRTVEIVHHFRGLVGKHVPGLYDNVECSHITRVKTYAPGVMHCVFDIQIGPSHLSK